MQHTTHIACNAALIVGSNRLPGPKGSAKALRDHRPALFPYHMQQP